VTAPSADAIALPARRRLAIPERWQRYWHLLWLSAVSDFKRRYAGTVLGYLWTVLRPLLLFAVLYTVVTHILFRFEGRVADYGALLLLNIVLWQFFAEASNGSMRSLTSRGGLVRKMPLPRTVMPLSVVLGTIFVLASNLLVAFVWIVVDGVEPMWTWLLFPFILAALIALTSGVALLLSALYPRFRDIGQIWPTVTRLLFYTTVLFPIELLPRVLQDLQSFNPVAPLVVQARVWMIDPDAPGWFEVDKSTFGELMPFIIFATLCVAGWILFARRAGRVAEEI
jgi:ABC-2 type transport system permease protein